MNILSTKGWNDYALIDSGNGHRLERFGSYTLIRPDPECIWQPKGSPLWSQADATFTRTTKDKGTWNMQHAIPDKWLLQYGEISFYVKCTPFKHTGVFPEQSIQWDWMRNKISTTKRPLNILNLFAYTGIASLVAVGAGAHVTHVDASKNTINWAKENQLASNLTSKPIRWILDDALTFAKRELKRGVYYDGIIVDPPVYGHGPNGEVWDFKVSFPQLMEVCTQLLSPTALFFIVNAYAISSSSLMLKNVFDDFLKNGNTEHGELALEETQSQRLLSTGIFARWSRV